VNLSTLKRMAKLAIDEAASTGDESAHVSLRDFCLANLDDVAAAFGRTVDETRKAVTEAKPEAFGRLLLGSCDHHGATMRQSKAQAKESESERVAASIAASARRTAFGLEIDAMAPLRADMKNLKGVRQVSRPVPASPCKGKGCMGSESCNHINTKKYPR